jgi:hypothetical protein
MYSLRVYARTLLNREEQTVAKAPSDKTLLERAKRDIRDLEKEVRMLRHELSAEKTRANTNAAQARNWEDRFDELLAAFKGRPAQSVDAVEPNEA